MVMGMKVLQLITDLAPYGAQRIAVDLCLGLRDRGISVELACLQGCAIRDVEDRLVRAGIPVHKCSGLFQLPRLLRRESYDILHTHLPFGHIAGRTAARMLSAPLVVVSTIHLPPWELRPSRFRALRLALRFRGPIVAASESIRVGLIRKMYIPARKINVIHNGVALIEADQPSPLREELNIPASCPLLGTASRLSPEKGLDVLLHSLALLFKRRQVFHCVIAGAGPLETDLRRLALKLKLQDRVHFLGFRRDVPRILKALDVFILPSRYEAFGLAAAEALRAGVPVVATDAGGIRELVRNGQTGILVQPEDPAALTEGICRMLDHPSQSLTFSRQARSVIREHFSLKKMIDAYAVFYYHFLSTMRKKMP